MIEKKYDKKRLSKINDIIGIGIDIEDHKFSKLSRNHYGNYILYAGRIDTYKGSRELMEFFLRYVKERNKKLNLVMIGRDYLGLPKRRNVIKLGYVSQNKKFNLLRHAKVVINPSFYESLSMLLLEAFFCAKPALVNGNCKVLKDQIIRSGAGLYYTNYDSFSRNLTKLLSNTRLRKDMGVKGRLFFNRYYAKEIIQFKYLKIFDKLINPKN